MTDGFRETRQVFYFLHLAAIADHGENAREGPQVHEDVNPHVNHYAGDAGSIGGGKPDQGITHVTDRGIGHQLLDIGLRDGGEPKAIEATEIKITTCRH